MKSLPQVNMVPNLEMGVYRKIREFFDDLLFSYFDELLKNNRVENDGDVLAAAIKSGKVIYSDGVFRPKTKFSNKMSAELENLGARYSRSAGGYRLSAGSFPPSVAQAIAQVRISNVELADKAQNYLKSLSDNLDFIRSKLSFEDEVEKIGKNLDGQFKRSMRTINVIPPELTSYQLAEIAKNYTYNLDYYIKKWAESEIIKLREDIGGLVLDGFRHESLNDVILRHKGVSQRKAAFLARQETKLLVAEYRKNRFKQQGVTKYRWSTVLDGRERELHRELNGRIFSWDDPPIIDATTGERGNPGEAYNCRCVAIPVIDDDWWDSVK